MNLKINELITHLNASKELLDYNNSIECQIINGTITEGKHIETIEGISFSFLDYTTKISMTGLAKDKFNMLLILIKAWLDDFDNLRTALDKPSFEITKSEENVEDIKIKIRFLDEICLTPRENGNITWQGTNYSLDKHDVNIATSGTVNLASV